MTTTRRSSNRSLPGIEWMLPWMQMAEIAWSAPVVIGYRTARLVVAGWPPSARDRREYTRMMKEKHQAFGQAAIAAATTPTKDTAKMVGAILAPVHRRVVANRRRLAGG